MGEYPNCFNAETKEVLPVRPRPTRTRLTLRGVRSLLMPKMRVDIHSALCARPARILSRWEADASALMTLASQ
eukprot:scaffold10483_cov65-Cyclotella_meneghiniana.AAC.1